MTAQDLPWYVLYTKSRNEKKVAERLSGAGYTVYCPLQKVRRQWSDRVKVVEEPLFKGYLFIKIEEKIRDEVFSFPGTVRYLFWLRRPAVVREEEIHTIQKWLGEYDHEDIDISRLLSPEITCASLPANSLGKRPFYWTALTTKPSFSSKNWAFNSPYRSRTTTCLRFKKQAQSRQCYNE